MVGDVVRCALERDLPHGPGRVVAEVAGQDGDAELLLLVEVEEALGTVDVVEGREAGHGAVDGHGVGAQLAAGGEHEPVRVGAAEEDALAAAHVLEVAQGVLGAGEAFALRSGGKTENELSWGTSFMLRNSCKN